METLLLSVVLCLAGAGSPPAFEPIQLIEPADEEFDRRKAEAKGDLTKLWALVDWCEANGLEKERRSVLRSILRLDKEDEKAHELLGHIFYEGRWFKTEKELAKFKRKQEAERKKEEDRRAKEAGLVRFGDEWVHPEDLEFLERGMVKDAYGEWVSPEEIERLANGWVRQDLEWVSPEEKGNIDKGLWKCGESWLALEEANAYHAEVGKWWRIPTDHFLLYTTCKRETADEVKHLVDQTFGDLVRVFGIFPSRKGVVAVLNSATQYNEFSANVVGEGLSSVHGACFTDAWFVEDQFQGAGLANWDESDPNGATFGELFAKHAAAQAFVEGIDPSPEAIKALKAGGGGAYLSQFWSEKRIPRWLRYGAASYAERYAADPFVGQGDDPFRIRKWAVENLLRREGLVQPATLFEFNLSPDNADKSETLISSAGLYVAYLLDGDDGAAKKKHAAFKAALKKARYDAKALKDLTKAIEDLEKVLAANHDQVVAFANANQ